MIERSRHSTPPEQQARLAAPADLERLWFMARAIGSRGYLHRFVPTEPNWCCMIGDQIDRALQRNEQLHPFELQRVTYVFNKAQARHNAQLKRLKPKCEHAVYLTSAVDEHGIKHWHGELVPLSAALLSRTEGSA